MEAFTIPLHRSLTEPIMIMGVPREMAIINGTIASALVLGLHSWLGLPLGLIFHLLAQRISRRDAYAFAVFRRHIWQKKYYGA